MHIGHTQKICIHRSTTRILKTSQNYCAPEYKKKPRQTYKLQTTDHVHKNVRAHTHIRTHSTVDQRHARRLNKQRGLNANAPHANKKKHSRNAHTRVRIIYRRFCCVCISIRKRFDFRVCARTQRLLVVDDVCVCVLFSSLWVIEHLKYNVYERTFFFAFAGSHWLTE